MPRPFSAYVICATPRSGSTLLCDLLTASGVAGEPHSYFRAQDIGYWAGCWGVEEPAMVADREVNRAYVAAMTGAGTANTGIFGLRLMWESVAEAGDRLNAAIGENADVACQIARTFGPTLFIHLSRRDKVAQAVSFIRAEQSGLWHVAADGSERERTAAPRPAVFYREPIEKTCETLAEEDRAWCIFFDQRGIRPLRVSYEELAADPRAVLANVLTALGHDPAVAAMVRIESARMADATSADWVRRIRRGEPQT